MYKWNDSAYDLYAEIPKTFDAREQWKMCHGIGKAFDEGMCSSSWVSVNVLINIQCFKITKQYPNDKN